jgi:hypothetical protein
MATRAPLRTWTSCPSRAPASQARRPKLSAIGILELDTDAGGLDIHMAPAGGAPYAELRRRALELELDNIRLAVAGRDDLIAMKRASGRPIDRGDIVALTEPELS